MKQEARRLCSSFGTRVESLNAFAIPLESTDRLLDELCRIDSEWQQLRNELADQIDFQVSDWAIKKPTERAAILALAPSRQDVIDSTRFFFTSFRLRPSDVDANTGVANDQAFTWRGTAGINGVGQLAMAYDGVTTVISGNIDANLAADFTIALLGDYTTTLSATDFVL